ncbi:MAG: 4Fe-4S dicluster domain-containing protein [bacterium]
MSDLPDPGRRRWLGGLLPRATEAVARVVSEEVERRLPPRRRPPGAVGEALFLAGCTRCGDCVQACPHRAIFTLAAHVQPGAGTPVMVPDERPCHGCEGFPCAAACTPGVLEVPDGNTWKLGTFHVVTERCLPFRGPECGACGGLCPNDPPALTFRLGRPAIDPDRCVGCGLCKPACPVRPAALELTPL